MMPDYGQEHIRGFGAGRCVRPQEVRIQSGYEEGSDEAQARRGENPRAEFLGQDVR